MDLYGWSSDLGELSSLKFFHNVSDAFSSLVLINLDLGYREGLHGIGADVSCNQSCSALSGHFLGRLYACAAGCHDARVGNRILAHAVQVNYHEKGAASKPGVHRGI
jgi:hypothetical protein